MHYTWYGGSVNIFEPELRVLYADKPVQQNNQEQTHKEKGRERQIKGKFKEKRRNADEIKKIKLAEKTLVESQPVKN